MPQINISDLLYLVGDENDKWPMIKDSSNFFLSKFNFMNYLTVGLDNFPFSDYLINSKIVSDWHIVSLNTNENEKVNYECIDTIKKVSESNEDYQGDNTNVQFGLKQFIDYDTVYLNTLQSDTNRNSFRNILKKLDSLEIVKIDSDDNERWVLNEIFEAGFLPSLLYVRFKKSPSENLQTRYTIGHLRMLGYGLLYVHENKYAFYFTGNTVYDCFNVEEQNLHNPLVNSVIKTTVAEFQRLAEEESKPDSSDSKPSIKSGLNVRLKKFY